MFILNNNTWSSQAQNMYILCKPIAFRNKFSKIQNQGKLTIGLVKGGMENKQKWRQRHDDIIM